MPGIFSSAAVTLVAAAVAHAGRRRRVRAAAGTALAALGAVALLAVGCGRGAPVRIGVVLPPDFVAGVVIAADEVNASGGVRGRRLELVTDSVPEGPPEGGAAHIVRATSVLRLPVVAVIGHEGSGQSLAAAPVYNAARVVQLVPTGTSRLLTQEGGWTLALAPNDSMEGQFIADFVRRRLGAQSVTIFYNNTEYGIGLRDGVRVALAGGGVRALRSVRYDAGSDLAVLVEFALRSGTPDAVVIAGYAWDAARLAALLRDHRVRAPIVAGDGAHVLPGLVAVRPDAVEGMYVVTFWLPGAADSATRRFEAVIRSQLGREPTARDAMAYDALRLLATAVGEVGGSPRRVRAYLLSLGVDRPPYRGITGEIGFGPGADGPRFVMGQVHGAVVRPAVENAP